MSRPKLTRFQLKAQKLLKQGNSVLLLAPTGLGKTLAVTADLEDKFTKTIYAVPLRALGVGICDAVSELSRNGNPIEPVVHHGDAQESLLFSEEVIVTTYDQVVCGVPGLPLSLPLKAGHAVAGALLMSRLILDEVHLAWAISDQALSILLAIVEFRKKLGLQTVVQTATLPDVVARMICRELKLDLVIVGKDGLEIIEDGAERIDEGKDEGVERRDSNRHVTVSSLELRSSGRAEQKDLDYRDLDKKLATTGGKRIYFCNTVGQLQKAYDRLIGLGIEPESVTVLHNRMPRSWRREAEKLAMERFGKRSKEGNWLLLTNQVAEAGLDISAPLVISDPAPVDTLVQRAGRCARWFRECEAVGHFLVITAAKTYIDDPRKGLALPYQKVLVHAALDSLPLGELTWDDERAWVNKAWAGGSKEAAKAVRQALDETAFALNLFDRAAQEHRPGEIANAFREILSVDIAVEDANSTRDLQKLVDSHRYPETSSVSLGQAWGLFGRRDGKARAIRYEEGSLRVMRANNVQPGDTLVVSSDVATLHRKKGLCLEELDGEDALKQSDWIPNEKADKSLSREGGRPQGLFEHTREVIEGTYGRLMLPGPYRDALIKILKSLEPEKDADGLANMIAQIATVAAGFHDFGKADAEWQTKARQIDPKSPAGLIGRTTNTKERIGRPHTPPGFLAILKACEMLIGHVNSAEHLIRTIALAAARHHSSLTNPALVDYAFEPDPEAKEFVEHVLIEVGASEEVRTRAEEIVQAACQKPLRELIPLALPNDDLFPIYALVGRAILMADRTSAASHELEKWRGQL
jgi:CRISPR-associated endonuclease/helicase Cas3